MDTYGPAAKELTTCPYDKTHKVLNRRLQSHIAKCARNHKEIKKLICPFNDQHRCEPGKYCDHLLTCSDRPALDRKLVVANTENNASKGQVEVSSYNSPNVQENESGWDDANAEDNTSKGHGGVPSHNSPNVQETESGWDDANAENNTSKGHVPPYNSPNVQENESGWDDELASNPSPAYEPSIDKLHRRNPDYEESEETSEKQQDTLPEIRKPKTRTYAEVLAQKPVRGMKNVGLVKGQPTRSASSKIAADVFKDQAKTQPRSAANISSPKTPSLRMGRGRSNSVARQNEADEMDIHFPRLGREM